MITGMRAVSASLVEGRHHFETAYLGHHQVQYDDVWQLPARGFDRLAAAVGADHDSGHAQHPDRHQLDRLWIVVDDEDREPLSVGRPATIRARQRIVQLLS